MNVAGHAEVEELLALAAELGGNPLLVQGPGGNISLKRDGVVWVKASGTWMAEALTKSILIPVDLAAVLNGLARREVYPDHTVYCGTKYFVHGVSESPREYLSDYEVRVIVISPGVIETKVLDGLKDPVTLANYKANKVKIGGGIGSEHIADLIPNAYNLPQNALVQETCITPTRQKY